MAFDVLHLLGPAALVQTESLAASLERDPVESGLDDGEPSALRRLIERERQVIEDRDALIDVRDADPDRADAQRVLIAAGAP